MEDGVEEIFEHTLTTIEGKRLKLSVAKLTKIQNMYYDCMALKRNFLNFRKYSIYCMLYIEN